MHILNSMQGYVGFSLRSGLFFCGVFLLCTHWGLGAEVTYVGTQTSTGVNNYAVHHWSLASVSKQYDFDGNNKYGSAGYYQLRPMPTSSGSTSVYEAALNENLLGTDSSSYQSFFSQPSFIGSITGKSGSFVNFNEYSNFVEPNSATAYRQGALSVSLPDSNGPYTTPSGLDTGYFGEIFQFTVSSPTVFRIGITVDSLGGGYAPDYVGIYNNITGTKHSTLLTRDAQPDMAIFEINALAGESYTVALWRVSGNPDGIAAFSLITFDEKPSDDTPPVIELNGATSVSVAWGGSYTDEGATATDDVDSVVTVIPSGAVNTSKPGVYTITFDATDAAGNSANQVIRTVSVSAPSSTTGANGLSGLMRYALGGNAPGDSVAKPVSSVTGGYLVITAIVRTDNPKLTVVGEAVTNLGNYASGTSVVEVQGVDAADQAGVPVGCKLRSFSIAQGSDAKKFLRLKASLAQ